MPEPVTYLLCVKCGMSVVAHTCGIPGACDQYTERTELEVFNEKENNESQCDPKNIEHRS